MLTLFFNQNPYMKAVILAAGKGERLKPLTDYKPKAMLPVCNKPLIEHQIESLRKHGIDEIAVVVGYLKDKMDLKGVKFYEDKLRKGTATALYAAKLLFISSEKLAMSKNRSPLTRMKSSSMKFFAGNCLEFGA